MGSALTKKLRLQPGQRVLLLNAPRGYLDLLGDLPDGASLDMTPDGDTYDFVQAFVDSIAELERLARSAIDASSYDGILWFSYPKKSSKVKTDISRDVGWDIVANAGLRPVMQVSIDETWSALRFRPHELIGS